MRSNLLGNVVDNLLRLVVAGLHAWPKDDIRPRYFSSLAVILNSNNAHICDITVA